jgi:hypothetical protein
MLAALVIGLFSVSQLAAQATLSVQGSIQKSTGAAIDDGDYAITFKFYTTETGGSAIWSETQDPVEIIGGVYSVTLGSVIPLNVPFDQPYFLGISVGTGQEHTPRTRLTSAPYALSLLGQDNKFPSTGNVGIGTTTPSTTLDVDGSVATEERITVAPTVAVAAQDHVIFLDHTANQNITLPAASASEGRHLMLVNKVAVAKTLTASNYLDLAGAISTTIPATGVVELQSDGSVWRQTGGYVQPVTTTAKAYVLAGPTGSYIYPSQTWTTVTFAEVEDAQNCFASNTFTAPRTGFYRVSGQLFGGFAGNGSWSGTTAPVLNIRGQGTCAFGAASRIIFGEIHAPGTTQHRSNLGADVYMTAGQTLFLQINHNGSSNIGFNGIMDSYISILEQ